MKRHDFDPLSFVGGIVMLAVGLLFLVPRATSDLIDYVSSAALWMWPVLFIAAGAAILVPAILKMRKSDPDDS